MIPDNFQEASSRYEKQRNRDETGCSRGSGAPDKPVRQVQTGKSRACRAASA